MGAARPGACRAASAGRTRGWGCGSSAAHVRSTVACAAAMHLQGRLPPTAHLHALIRSCPRPIPAHDLFGTDCARARIKLCTAFDALCEPFLNSPSDDEGTYDDLNAHAAVAKYARYNCPVPRQTQSGDQGSGPATHANCVVWCPAGWWSGCCTRALVLHPSWRVIPRLLARTAARYCSASAILHSVSVPHRACR